MAATRLMCRSQVCAWWKRPPSSPCSQAGCFVLQRSHISTKPVKSLEPLEYKTFDDKIEGVPWSIRPEEARGIMWASANAVFLAEKRLQAWLLLIPRLVRNLLSLIPFVPLAPSPPHARLLHFRAIYLPTWMSSFSLSADAWTNGHPSIMSLHGTLLPLLGTDVNAFAQLPLKPLELQTSQKTRLWNASRPPQPAKEEGEDRLTVTTLPFQRSPSDVLAKLKDMPRKFCGVPPGNEEDKLLRWEPRSIKASILAFYPVYLPMFIGEYEATDQSERRATVLCRGWRTSPDQDVPDLPLVWKAWSKVWVGHRITDPLSVDFHLRPVKSGSITGEDSQKIESESLPLVSDGLRDVPFMARGSPNEIASSSLKTSSIMRFAFAKENAFFVESVNELSALQAGHQLARDTVKALEGKRSEAEEESGREANDVVLWQLGANGLRRASLKDMQQRLERLRRMVSDQEKAVEAATPKWLKTANADSR